MTVEMTNSVLGSFLFIEMSLAATNLTFNGYFVFTVYTLFQDGKFCWNTGP